MKKTGCLFYISIMVLNITVGAWSIREILSWFGKSIPTVWNVLTGLVIGEISIPIAIVGHVLKICGVI